MAQLFVYGTLVCEDIMSQVAGSCHRLEDATLRGYRRHPVRGEHFPGVVPAAGHAVPGVIYGALDRRALARLDRFEGPMYRRDVVRVSLAAGGGHRRVFAYVVRDAYRHHLEDGEWDLETFLREDRRAFQRRHVGHGRT